MSQGEYNPVSLVTSSVVSNHYTSVLPQISTSVLQPQGTVIQSVRRSNTITTGGNQVIVQGLRSSGASQLQASPGNIHIQTRTLVATPVPASFGAELHRPSSTTLIAPVSNVIASGTYANSAYQGAATSSSARVVTLTQPTTTYTTQASARTIVATPAPVVVQVQNGERRESVGSVALSQIRNTIGRSIRPSWYSNRDNGYDFKELSVDEIKKIKVYTKYYVLKTHEDDAEYRVDSFPAPGPLFGNIRSAAEQYAQTGNQNGRSAVVNAVVTPDGASRIHTKQVDFQSNTNGLFDAGRSSPGSAQITPLRDLSSLAASGKILNAEDLISMAKQMNVVGRTVYGDPVFGYDEHGNPVIDTCPTTMMPIFGYLFGTGSPIYGYHPSGQAFTIIDKENRPALGYTSSRHPVYELKGRYHVLGYDADYNQVIGFLENQRPVYSISHAGWVATELDPVTKLPIFGFDEIGQAVTEAEVALIEDLINHKQVVATDSHGNLIYGFTESGFPIYTFSPSGKPILGFNSNGSPVYGVHQSGHLILGFHPETQQPIFGYDSKAAQISDPKNINGPLFFPPGIPIALDKLQQLFDQWGRPISRQGISQIQPVLASKYFEEHANQGYPLLDSYGKKFTNPGPLQDEKGRILPEVQIATNSKGMLIGSKTSSDNETTVAQSVIKRADGSVLGFVGPRGVIVDQSGKPLAVLGKNGELESLELLSLATGFKIAGNSLVNSSGVAVGQIHPDGTVRDALGSLLGTVDPAGHFTKASFSYNPKVAKTKATHDFKDGKIISRENGSVLGVLNAIITTDPQTGAVIIQQEIRDSQNSLIALVSAEGAIYNSHGEIIGQLHRSGEPEKTSGNKSILDEVFSHLRPSVDLALHDGCPKLFFMDAEQNPVALVNLRTLAVLSPAAIQIGHLRSDGVIVNSQGEAIARMDKEGNLTGGLQGHRVGIEEFKSALSTKVIDPAKLQALLSGRVSSDKVFLLDGQGKPFGVYRKATGDLVDTKGNLIGHVTPSGAIVTAKGETIGKIDALGNISGQVNAFRVDAVSFNQAVAGAVFSPAELKKLQSESQRAEKPRKVGSHTDEPKQLFILDAQGKPVGIVDREKKVLLSNTGTVIGHLQADGKVVDLKGSVIATVDENGNLTGKKVGFRVDAEVFAQATAGKAFSAAELESLQEQSKKPLSQQNHNMYLVDRQGKPIGILSRESGELISLNGHRIGRLDQSGRLLDEQGGIIATLDEKGNLRGSGLSGVSVDAATFKDILAGRKLSLSELEALRPSHLELSARSSVGAISSQPGLTDAELFLADNQGVAIGVFNRRKGTLTTPDGRVIGRVSAQGQIVTDDGRVLARMDSSGNLHGDISGFRVDSETFKQLAAGRRLSVSEVEKLKQASTKQRLAAVPSALAGTVLVSADNQPLGTVNSNMEVISATGEKIGIINPDGTFKATESFAKKGVPVRGLINSQTGQVVATLSGNGTLLLADGSSVGELLVQERLLNLATMTGGKTLFGFAFDELENKLIDDLGRVVGVVDKNYLYSVQGVRVAQVLADHTGKDTQGNFIDKDGQILDRDGKRIGKVILTAQVSASQEDIIPISKKFPIIADVSGHKIIGFNSKGEAIIGIQTDGQPIMGKRGINKAGQSVLAISTDGKEVSQSFLDEIIRASKLEHEEALRALSAAERTLIQEIREEDSDEDAWAASQGQRLSGKSQNISPRRSQKTRNGTITSGTEDDTEEEDEDDPDNQVMGLLKRFLKKNESISDNPLEALLQQAAVGEKSDEQKRQYADALRQIEANKDQFLQQVQNSAVSSYSNLP